jgi:hypothetical protein
MKFPFVSIVGDYHEFDDLKDNFLINGVKTCFKEIGYFSPSDYKLNNQELYGYVAVFWERGKKNKATLNLIKRLSEEYNKQEIEKDRAKIK